MSPLSNRRRHQGWRDSQEPIKQRESQKNGQEVTVKESGDRGNHLGLRDSPEPINERESLNNGPEVTVKEPESGRAEYFAITGNVRNKTI